MDHLLTAAFWLALLVGIYILGYLLNKKTPKPEGCENLTQDCEGCAMVDCTHNPVHKEEIK